jgi:hypothetical protein
MTQYTVTKEDEQIYIDGISCGHSPPEDDEKYYTHPGRAGADMSGFPDDFSALQWDGSNGHIEYSDVLKPNLIISSESEIESALGVSLATMIERRTAKIAEVAEEWDKVKEDLLALQ